MSRQLWYNVGLINWLVIGIVGSIFPLFISNYKVIPIPHFVPLFSLSSPCKQESCQEFGIRQCNQPMPDQKLSSLKSGTTWSLPPGWTRLGCGCHREKVQSSQSLPWSQRDSVDDVLGKKINCFIFSIQFPPGTTFHLLPGTQEDHHCHRCKRSFPFRLWTNKYNVSWYTYNFIQNIPNRSFLRQ